MSDTNHPPAGPDLTEDATQTPGPDSTEDGSQTPGPDSTEDGSQTPGPDSIEDGSQTPASSNPIADAIADAIAEHEVILFMKGVPDAPACGFSARTVAVLQALEVPFASVDILPDPLIRQELTTLSSWPTIPQLFVRGELVGGCDIVSEMYESGELAELLGKGEGPAPVATTSIEDPLG